MKVLFRVLFVAVFGLIAGCGSGSSNDQGVSFLLTGFYTDSTGDTGVTGYSIPVTDLTDSEANGSNGGWVISYVGLRNNMVGQYVRVQRLYISYVVDGSNLTPPSTTSPLTVVLTPTSTDAASSLPGNLTGANLDGLGNISFAGFPVMQPSVRAWFALNRNNLPEPPYTVEAVVYASGVTSSGNTLDTNVGSLYLNIVPDVVIPPTDGTDTGSTGADTTSNSLTDNSELSTVDESELQ